MSMNLLQRFPFRSRKDGPPSPGLVIPQSTRDEIAISTSPCPHRCKDKEHCQSAHHESQFSPCPASRGKVGTYAIPSADWGSRQENARKNMAQIPLADLCGTTTGCHPWRGSPSPFVAARPRMKRRGQNEDIRQVGFSAALGAVGTTTRRRPGGAC